MEEVIGSIPLGSTIPLSRVVSLSGMRTAIKTIGALAQLGERFHGMEEVIGSIPLGSTIFLQRNAAILAFCAVKQVPTAPSW
jgi:hypothetical protein